MIILDSAFHLGNKLKQNVHEVTSELILELKVVFASIPNRFVSPLFEPFVEAIGDEDTI